MFIMLGVRKARAVKTGKVNRHQAALDNRVWPEEVVKVSNNIANQFEAPVLFYVLCLVTYSIIAAVSVWMRGIVGHAHLGGLESGYGRR
ncbi:MAPEG family protein [Marinobacter alkaliphilus]|uniref:MAPEG family protein n=1 Tax=Marinobacter alkaliphilus TaxID=254719 RepID=A0ABZ3E544_9GAMM